MATSIAIALFAGLRPSEIAALAPGDIRERGIRVRGGKLRRKTSRMVPIPENLAEWLQVFPFKGLPSHHQRSYWLLRKATKAANWAQDVLRHTSISFQLERDQDEARTLFNTGTSKQMVDRHYREVIEVNLAEEPATPKRIAWPSDEKLLEMVASLPMTQVGKQLGVSDNAVRKRLKKRGLG